MTYLVDADVRQNQEPDCQFPQHARIDDEIRFVRAEPSNDAIIGPRLYVLAE